MTPALLAEYAAIMRAHRVLEVAGEETQDAMDFRIVLSPTAFDGLPTPSGEPDVPENLGEEERCPCGHLVVAEHNAHGLCIAGACPVTMCHPEATAKPG
jgi:hypothetical protein